MKLLRWLPAIFWMAIMFYLSSQPTAIIHGSPTARFYILKSFHLIEYAVLAGLILFACLRFRWTVFLAYLFALSDEYHQTFTPGRTGKLFETLIDLLGICLGLLLIRLILKHLVRRT